MPILEQSRRLRKELTLGDVYSISLGATLSSGFFLLPGLAAAEAGPVVVLTYMIAALPLIPGIISIAELATAMPRAGGVYYYLDRSMGPVFGTIGGIGTWLTLVLKVGFALVGMGAYLHIFWPDVPIRALAVPLAIGFGALNVLGTRKTGRFQLLLIMAVLACLAWFVLRGTPQVRMEHFDGFWSAGAGPIISTAGLVCVSYIGLTKIASVSEEIVNPEKTIPRAIFLALGTATVIYVVGNFIMVGVLPPEVLYRGPQPDLTPVSTTAGVLGGVWGARVMAIAAVLAFFSVANAGILSASRYPLAMSRDELAPSLLSRLGRHGTPANSIVLTVLVVLISVMLLDPLTIAKLAGAFQLALFAMSCIAVIVMRESRIESYDPGFRSPLYPWMQIVGIMAPGLFIAQMGWTTILFSLGFIVAGIAWYLYYGKPRVMRHGAIYDVFERLGRQPTTELDRELRGIMKEKGLRAEDPFDEIVLRASVLDARADEKFDQIVARVSTELARRVGATADSLSRGFMEGTRTGLTPVSKGVALPHLRLEELDLAELALVRCRRGIQIPIGDVFGQTRTVEDTHAIFFLVSPDRDPGQHLRVLAQLASRVDQEDFLDAWLAAAEEQDLKEVLLRDERFVSITAVRGQPSQALLDRPIRELDLPDGCLVAVIRREGVAIVPRGGTVIRDGDRITVIGQEKPIRELRRRLRPTP